MPRLIRRKPLIQRLQAALNPYDFWLWLSEEIETREWDTKSVASYLGATLHVLFLIARANSGPGRGKGRIVDDVFGDVQDLRGGRGWFGWLATLIVYGLTWISVINAAFTFLRKRHYRLFEQSIDDAPSTPSAHRVRVSSSPVSSSPLRFLTQILTAEINPISRAHPDPTLDVWEIAVWDPLPLSLRLFCLFSPGHVLVYWLFLPLSPLDPRPSVAVVTTILLEILLSAQLLFLQSNFSQQTKDTAVIHKEVLHEYDTKYVHPRLHPTVRDVGTQFSGPDAEPGKNRSRWRHSEEPQNEVETYTPTTILRRGFKTNPNPNYGKHISPDDVNAVPKREVFRPTTPSSLFKTPSAPNIHMYTQPSSHQQSQQPLSSVRESSPLKNVHSGAIRQPQFRSSLGPGGLPNRDSATSTANTTGSDGGSLGIYSHANSPLKKASSMYDIQRNLGSSFSSSAGAGSAMPRNSFQAARREIAEERERERERSRSPVKRVLGGSASGGGFGYDGSGGGRRTSGPSKFGGAGGVGGSRGYY